MTSDWATCSAHAHAQLHWSCKLLCMSQPVCCCTRRQDVPKVGLCGQRAHACSRGSPLGTLSAGSAFSARSDRAERLRLAPLRCCAASFAPPPSSPSPAPLPQHEPATILVEPYVGPGSSVRTAVRVCAWFLALQHCCCTFLLFVNKSRQCFGCWHLYPLLDCHSWMTSQSPTSRPVLTFWGLAIRGDCLCRRLGSLLAAALLVRVIRRGLQHLNLPQRGKPFLRFNVPYQGASLLMSA